MDEELDKYMKDSMDEAVDNLMGVVSAWAILIFLVTWFISSFQLLRRFFLHKQLFFSN